MAIYQKINGVLVLITKKPNPSEVTLKSAKPLKTPNSTDPKVNPFICPKTSKSIAKESIGDN